MIFHNTNTSTRADPPPHVPDHLQRRWNDLPRWYRHLWKLGKPPTDPERAANLLRNTRVRVRNGSGPIDGTIDRVFGNSKQPFRIRSRKGLRLHPAEDIVMLIDPPFPVLDDNGNIVSHKSNEEPSACEDENPPHYNGRFLRKTERQWHALHRTLTFSATALECQFPLATPPSVGNDTVWVVPRQDLGTGIEPAAIQGVNDDGTVHVTLVSHHSDGTTVTQTCDMKPSNLCVVHITITFTRPRPRQ